MHAQHRMGSRVAERRCGWFGAGGSLRPNGVVKQWDIFYSNQGGDWNDYARNWTLAKACFKRLIVELNLKVWPAGTCWAAPACACRITLKCISCITCATHRIWPARTACPYWAVAYAY